VASRGSLGDTTRRLRRGHGLQTSGGAGGVEERGREGAESGPGAGDDRAQRNEALESHRKKAAILARRALALAESYPTAPEAPEALIWIIDQSQVSAERDTAYDRLTERYLDKDAILPLIRTAWLDCETAHSEAFLRAAVERSPNLKVRALSCFSLGRHLQELAAWARLLNNPTRKKMLEASVDPETTRRILSLQPERLKREAEAFYEQTVKEFADLRPLGMDFPPLGE
jgi:thiol-disulfide isomerase/thioredoxin